MGGTNGYNLLNASCPPISLVRRIYYYRKNIIKNLLMRYILACISPEEIVYDIQNRPKKYKTILEDSFIGGSAVLRFNTYLIKYPIQNSQFTM